MDGFGLTVLLLALAGALTSGLTMVPAGMTFEVTRFGRHLRMLRPGVHFIVPLIDKIGERRPDAK
jgi:regulator of protease activity HflC (stomatin/prohibitin superfamily)